MCHPTAAKEVKRAVAAGQGRKTGQEDAEEYARLLLLLQREAEGTNAGVAVGDGDAVMPTRPRSDGEDDARERQGGLGISGVTLGMVFEVILPQMCQNL